MRENPMIEKKSVLARLLANENITVQQGNFDTAYFDVINRVLGLPLFKDMSNDVYDLMIGHEVSHALYTPTDPEVLKVKGIPFSYVNVVEDIRIEKLILRKYPGLVANFKRGYLELIESDFFKTKDVDISTLSFMDRLNLKAKARDLIDIEFSDEEKPYFDLAMSVETFDDVVVAVKKIAEWLSNKRRDEDEPSDEQDNQKPQPSSEEKSDQENDGEGESSSDQDGDEESDQDGDEESDENGEGESSSERMQRAVNEIIESMSNKDVNDKEDDSNLSSGKSAYNEEPDTYDLEEVSTDVAQQDNTKSLIDSDVIYAQGMTREYYEKITTHYKDAMSHREEHLKLVKEHYPNRTRRAEESWLEFQSSSKPVVNLMAKEFEMRKAAYRTQRAMTSTKGSLDVNKLHSYKYDDQLFKQVTSLADGKSHGLIMLVDYSGSMHNCLPNVLKQNATLVMFCKRVGIPFEVYGFTSSNGVRLSENTKLTRFDSDDLTIFNIYSSRMSKRELEFALKSSIYQAYEPVFRPFNERLGNTPLNASLMAMEFAVKDFRKANVVEKLTFVTLTDGESNSVRLVSGNDLERDSYVKPIVVPINGKNITLKREYRRDADSTGKIMNAVFGKNTRKINFYICDNSGFRGQLYAHLPFKETEQKAARKQMRDDGAWVLDKNSGYDRRFIILDKNASMSGESENLDVEDNATPAQIAKAFKKFSGSKKGNRVITKKFAEVIA